MRGVSKQGVPLRVPQAPPRQFFGFRLSGPPGIFLRFGACHDPCFPGPFGSGIGDPGAV
jgi:hypothetical protein